MMTYKQKAVLKKEILAHYKGFMGGLYKEWAREGISSPEVRLQVGSILYSHICEQTISVISRKSQKARRIREAAQIAELELIKPIEPSKEQIKEGLLAMEHSRKAVDMPVTEFKHTFQNDENDIFGN